MYIHRASLTSRGDEAALAETVNFGLTLESRSTGCHTEYPVIIQGTVHSFVWDDNPSENTSSPSIDSDPSRIVL